MTYPDGVHQGDTFNIKIRPDVSLYPRTDTSTGIAATDQLHLQPDELVPGAERA